jgi:hypothetical protein
MKKLLLSTALAGVVLSTSAIAQTTVGGNMTVGLRATEEKGISGAATTASKRGMLMETQLNVASKGALNNGMSYAAGFSLEFDANDHSSTTATKSIANENAYIDLISGTTTFSAGIDHMNDFDRSMIPVVGEIGRATGSQGGTSAVTNMLADPLNTSAAAGVAVRQAFPGVGQLTLAYTPTMSCNSTDIQGCGGADTAVTEGAEGSGYSALLEIANVGIKGLALEAGYTEQAKKVGSLNSSNKDATFLTAGLRYTDGAISAGYNRKKFEFGGATGTTPTTVVGGGYTAGEERTQNDYGISYTVGNISYGAIYQVTSSNIAAELDEKIQSYSNWLQHGSCCSKS